MATTVHEQLDGVEELAAQIDKDGPTGASSSKCLAVFLGIAKAADTLMENAKKSGPEKLAEFHATVASTAIACALVLACFEHSGGRIVFIDPPESKDDAAGSKQGS